MNRSLKKEYKQTSNHLDEGESVEFRKWLRSNVSIPGSGDGR